MGKMKKVRLTRGGPKVPLEEQIVQGNYAKKKDSKPKIRFRKDEDEKALNGLLSKQILNQVRQQKLEIENEEETPMEPTTSLGDESSSEEEIDINEQSDNAVYDNIVINEEDEKALETFMCRNPTPRITLADIIMEKITEKQTEIKTQFSDGDSLQLQDINPRVKEMYMGVKKVLSCYRTGKIPKAFKIVPKLKNWEQILYITDPSCWSAAAMYQATRIFASNLKEKMAQRFFNLVLLPRVRDDISEYKRLNFHLYQALRKALFKPGAFMKGIVIPLCEGGCTLREAIIVCSVISKYSIPMLHSAATLLKLAEMEYNGATSIFLRTFLDKKYALPYRVIDAIVFHYVRFERDERELPVLWHQSFLTFVQRYKSDISSEQKEALLKLLHHQRHHAITPIIRRELESAKCRDAETSEPMITAECQSI